MGSVVNRDVREACMGEQCCIKDKRLHELETNCSLTP